MLRKSTISLALTLLMAAFISDFLSLFLAFSCAIFNNKSLLVIVLIINVLVLCVLLYSKSYEEGFKDPNRVKYGRMDYFIYKGFVSGLLADIPFILIYLVLIICWFFKLKFFDVMWIIMNIFNLQYFPSVSILKQFPIALVVTLLPIPLVSGISYILGYKQITITRKFIYKKDK